MRDVSVFSCGGRHLPIDIGTTSITGIGRGVLDLRDDDLQASESFAMIAPPAALLAGLGSDFQRAGALFPRRGEGDNDFTDRYGVGWLVTHGSPAPWEHPLEKLDWEAVARHPKPPPPTQWQTPDGTAPPYVILDAPCPGLIDTCFALRNAWQFMEDLTDNWRVAGALLDWAVDVIMAHYDAALAAQPRTPDVILYADDLGFQDAMYLSNVDFRNFVYPRLKTLISRIRSLSNAQLCLHSCGAIAPVLGEIAQLDFEMMNLDFMAKGMIVADVRKAIAADTVLHAPFDLAALGRAVREGDRRGIVLLTADLVAALPAIAAPADMMLTRADLADALRGAAFVRALDSDDIDRLRRFGPVAPILRRATDAALTANPEARLSRIDGQTEPIRAETAETRRG